MSDRASAVFDLPAPRVSRLACQECAGRACETLAGIPGVAKVECDAAGGSVQVEFDSARVTEADLLVELERFGMQLAESHRHAAWRITGLD